MKLNSNFSTALACSLVLGRQSTTASQELATPQDHGVAPHVASTSIHARAATQEVEAWTPEDGVDILLSRAIVHSPKVRQAYQAWQVALERVPQVTALPDPWLSLTGYVQSVETRTGPMDARIGFTQKLPWPGKLDAAGDYASAQAEVARNQVEVARLGIRRMFLRNWAERIYLRKAEEITAAQVALLEHIEEVSLRLYESSRVPQADVLRTQVERLEMVDRLDTLIQREAPLISIMESALGAPIDAASSWDTLEFYPSSILAEESILKQRLMAESPVMQQQQARLLVSQQAQEVAELSGRPDLSIGADWTWIGNGNPVQPGAGDDAFAMTLAVELPLGKGRIDGARRQALANRRLVVAQIEARQWELLAELQQALSSYEDALRRIHLFEQRMLPLSEQTYETTLAAYQSGQAGFQDMLDAARVMLDFRLSSARASADAALAIADLHGLLTEELLLAENLER
jgi:outer membrane protein TolC